MLFSQNCPGNIKDVPKTISEAVHVHPKSSLITFLMDNKTSSKFSIHILELSLAVRAVLSYLWNHLINRFAQGWYAAIFICLIPNSFVNSSKSVDWNWEPLSIVISEGQPKNAIHSRKIVLETVSAEISLGAGWGDGDRPSCKPIYDGEWIMMVICFWQWSNNITV